MLYVSIMNRITDNQICPLHIFDSCYFPQFTTSSGPVCEPVIVNRVNTKRVKRILNNNNYPHYYLFRVPSFLSNVHELIPSKVSHFVYTLFTDQPISIYSSHSSNIHILFSLAESMKAITIWDIALLLEAVVYVIFAGLVALEYCSTSYNVYGI